MLALRRGICCLALALVSGGVSAQDAAKTEAAAAMERAQRQASNPMRFILEAGKVKTKPGADGAPVVASSSAAAAPRSDAGVITPRMAVAPVATTVPAPEPAAPVVAPPKLIADSLQRQTEAVAVPALEASGSAAQAVPALATLEAVAPAALPAPPPAAMAAPVRPKIVNMVEPAIPPRALDDAGDIGTISVDLTIRADGTVAAVTMVPPVPRQIQRYLVVALEQWRFEPLAEERVHRVQLVFNSER